MGGAHVTVAEIEFMSEIVGGTVIFGEADAVPLLGDCLGVCRHRGRSHRPTAEASPGYAPKTGSEHVNDTRSL